MDSGDGLADTRLPETPGMARGTATFSSTLNNKWTSLDEG